MLFDLEKHLERGIPQDEAAAFFLSLKGEEKQASAEELEAAWNELAPEEQDAILKEAEAAGLVEKDANMGAGGMSPPSLPPTAMGQNMPSMPKTSLPPTAMGQNAVKSAEAKTPKERAHEQIEIAHEKTRHSTGETVGKHVGTALGALGGAAAGGSKHRVVGAIAGGLAGRSAGRDIGERRDIKHFDEKMKHAAAQMKIAFGNGLMPEGTPGDTPDIHSYLAAEEMGGEAEQSNAAAYYQQKFQQAAAELQQTQEQAEQTQTMADTLQQQVAGSQEQIQAAMQQAQMASQAAMQNVQQAHEMAMGATSQAMESQAEVLRQKQLAAAMKMGITQVKDQVMSALAADPTDQLAQQLTSPPPGSGGMVGGAPGALDPNAQNQMQNPSTDAAGNPVDPAGGAPGQPGTPGQEAGAQTPAGSTGTGEEGESASDGKSEKSKSEGSSSDTKGTTKVEVKHGSAKFASPLSLPHALGGAAVGALGGAAYSKMSNEPLRKKVSDLEAQGEGGFSRSLDLAQAKMRLAFGENAERHPGMTIASRALVGGVLGGTVGPEAMRHLGEIKNNVAESIGNLRGVG
jgi:hypothetical protein